MNHPASLTAALDMLVLERQDGGFALREDPPAWFHRLGLGIDERERPLRIELNMPFLEAFLPEAERAWVGENAERVDSECWTETAIDGEELHLEAMALTFVGARLLIVTRNDALFFERRRVLQRARELRLAHDALACDLERKDVLIHCIVHDLAAPLNAMLGSLSLLEEQAELGPRITSLISVATNAALRQRDLIREILDVFAAERSGLDIPYDEFAVTPDLWEAIADATETLLPVASNLGIRLELRSKDLSRPRCEVIGEPRRLTRVLFNLLSNAIRFTPPATSVRVSVEDDVERAEVRVTVDDEGPGVAPQVVPHLFQKFAKGRDPGAGTGLGLYFCRITLENWGGSIGYEPRPEGGARFWFRLRRGAANRRDAAGIDEHGRS